MTRKVDEAEFAQRIASDGYVEACVESARRDGAPFDEAQTRQDAERARASFERYRASAACSQCGNTLTITDAGALCGQCRRSLHGGRAQKVRRATEYERAEYARKRKAGTLG